MYCISFLLPFLSSYHLALVVSPDSSQTGLAVESLQDQLPDACVLYSSATGASEPDNLRYMVRLGSFGYPHIGDMINVLKRWVLLAQARIQAPGVVTPGKLCGEDCKPRMR